MTKTWYASGRHYSDTNIKIEYEQVNPRLKKSLKLSKESVVFAIETNHKFLLSK